jgi:hypothetical protein
MLRNRLSVPFLPVGTGRTSGMRTIAIAVGILTLILTGLGTADAQECRTNYYRCDLNRGGRVDPSNPGCCWSPVAGRPSRDPVCLPNFYKCDLNRDGRVDPNHPGCCWNLR